VIVFATARVALDILDAQVTQSGSTQQVDKPAPEQSTQPPDISSIPREAMFHYARANSFRVLTRQLRCDLLDEALYAALN
jgi:hypothetical protein